MSTIFYFKDMSIETVDKEEYLINLKANTVFETCLLQRVSGLENTAIIKYPYAVSSYNKHYERFAKGCSVFGYDTTSFEDFHRIIKEKLELIPSLAELNRLRIMYSGRAIDLLVENYSSNYKQFVRAISFYGTRNTPEIKSTPVSLSFEARKKAVLVGAYEAILVDNEGIVREGAWSNFFWRDNLGVWHTPINKILNGITRGDVLRYFEKENILCKQIDFLLTEIKERITAAFVTSSLTGIVFLSTFDEVVLRQDEEFLLLVEGFSLFQQTLLELVC